MKRALIGALVVLAFVAVGCGDDDTAEGDDSLSVSGLCAESEPDCQDVGVVDATNGGDAGATSAGMVVDGGLTVSDALTSTATGTLAVKGFLVADSNAVRLCEALAESMPPQCGGASIEIADVSAENLDVLGGGEGIDLRTAGDVQWTDNTITLLGEVVDGRLVIDTLAR